MALDLDALVRLAVEAKARADKASDGPWEYDPVLDGTIESARGGAVASVAEHTSSLAVSHSGEMYSGADARFIAAARSDVPALADAVMALTDEVRGLRVDRYAYRAMLADSEMDGEIKMEQRDAAVALASDALARLASLG